MRKIKHFSPYGTESIVFTYKLDLRSEMRFTVKWERYSVKPVHKQRSKYLLEYFNIWVQHNNAIYTAVTYSRHQLFAGWPMKSVYILQLICQQQSSKLHRIKYVNTKIKYLVNIKWKHENGRPLHTTILARTPTSMPTNATLMRAVWACLVNL